MSKINLKFEVRLKDRFHVTEYDEILINFKETKFTVKRNDNEHNKLYLIPDNLDFLHELLTIFPLNRYDIKIYQLYENDVNILEDIVVVPYPTISSEYRDYLSKLSYIAKDAVGYINYLYLYIEINEKSSGDFVLEITPDEIYLSDEDYEYLRKLFFINGYEFIGLQDKICALINESVYIDLLDEIEFESDQMDIEKDKFNKFKDFLLSKWQELKMPGYDALIDEKLQILTTQYFSATENV